MSSLLDAIASHPSKFRIGDVVWFCKDNNIVSGKITQKRYNYKTERFMYICQNESGERYEVNENDAFESKEEVD